MKFEELSDVKNMRRAKECCALLMNSRVKQTRELSKEIDVILTELIEIYRKDFNKIVLDMLTKINKNLMGKA